ncbi:heavy metal-responsive transcriptional regulator [Nostoc sp. FACHB-87]|uniref:heavy metal-responsive transcriptional regulator n=1 Tax=Nostocaceae TaxID=1162 RepID=UPI00168519E5|nr:MULTISPECIES: heavy metal-responsive transcriptional regulator [Nostocaceae]MBD2456364.1 heavy metal-responsive transcriptional regulator [Nostoc sp. FACHB-87]MBD2477778.1 heavy metal-responsive transcriptional regulator [Anabaena sp. FACHB-83]
MLVQEKSKQIGVVAKESGVPIKTIRYYEELGLLKSSGRTEGGFRLFNTDVLARLHFIKRAQSLGLTLSEIKEFLNVHDEGELPCEHIKTKLEDKVQAIDDQIQQLLVLRQDLSGMLSGWKIQSETYHPTICPIIN